MNSLETREQEILLVFSQALPLMSEFDKGYFLGKAENLVDSKKQDKSEDFDKPA